MIEQARQHGQDQTWVGTALEDALDTDSPILRSFQAGGLPALQEIVNGLQANDHRDREILLVASVYLMLGDLMLKTDSETSDRAAIVAACRELGRLGRWLISSRPETLEGTRALVATAAVILDARTIAPGSALAQGPASDLLTKAAKS